MKNAQWTMVDPKQIVKKGYRGCNSERTVVSFAQKNGVPCLWWKPIGSPKILLVELTQFRDAWKQAKTGTSGGATRGTRKSATAKMRGGQNLFAKRSSGRGTGRTTIGKTGRKTLSLYSKTRKTGTAKKTRGSAWGANYRRSTAKTQRIRRAA